MYICVWSVVLFQLEKVERERVAGNWLLNSDKAIPEDGGESEITHTLRHGMPLEKLSHTLHALYVSLNIYECMFYLVSTYSNKHPKLLKCVSVWINRNTCLCFSRIQYSEGWWGDKKAGEE